MTPFKLAILNLLHQPIRTLISMAGVAFAVLLLFVQLGFLGAVQKTATLFYDHLDFDLLLVSTEYLEMHHAGTLSRFRLAQAREVPGVTAVRPLSLSVGLWRDPRPKHNPSMPPRRWNILLVGVDPTELHATFRNADGVFPHPGGAGEAGVTLGRLDTVLLDRRSWPSYGEPEDRRPGEQTDLNGHRITIGGDVEIGTGFGYNGLSLASEATYAQLIPQARDRVSFGLVKLEKGKDTRLVKAAIRAATDQRVDVLTRQEINERERYHWVQATSGGRFFMVGVILALFVGGVFVSQMMAADIRSRLPEYATLRALGYDSAFLRSVVICQALLLSLVGYIPGVAAALVSYGRLNESARIPIGMDGERAAIVLVLTVLMCLAAGVAAVRHVHQADPADLF